MNIGPNSLADAESMIDAIGTRPAREALEIRRFCDEWYGYHVRSLANTSIEAGVADSAFGTPWQRQLGSALSCPGSLISRSLATATGHRGKVAGPVECSVFGVRPKETTVPG
ncbi:hypothetical protein FHS21_003159 [Phyllobacterium trifolii]|uniref:Uncharacterized protein n=1 Tax=Phyllobacterium trifolii TaxID=300193 RepID=A0A839UA52_9HYPH|nr:hypothetical protein [Phyllobacterium trifolii]MBB3146743.1 hypothetical protein [Phyllobacterium trifolii]